MQQDCAASQVMQVLVVRLEPQVLLDILQMHKVNVIPHLQDIKDSCTTSSEDQRSMYETLDELIRGNVLPSDLPALAVEFNQGKLWSVNNRRLLVLKWFQACRQDQTVWATCRVNRSREMLLVQWDVIIVAAKCGRRAWCVKHLYATSTHSGAR